MPLSLYLTQLNLGLYTALANNAEAAHIRLIIAPSALIADTLILGA